MQILQFLKKILKKEQYHNNHKNKERKKYFAKFQKINIIPDFIDIDEISGLFVKKEITDRPINENRKENRERLKKQRRFARHFFTRPYKNQRTRRFAFEYYFNLQNIKIGG